MWMEEVGKGKYKFTERYKDIMTGKWKRVSIITDKKDKKTAFAALQAKIKEKVSYCADSSTTTLDALINAYSAWQRKHVRESTWNRNEMQEKKLSRILEGDVLVNKLTASYVINKFTDTGEDNTCMNQRMKTFKAMIRWGYGHDMVRTIDWLAKIEKFPEPTEKEKDKYKYLEGDELNTLLTAMDIPLWRALTKFLALSGMRIGEAIALEKSDVDLDARTISVSKTYNPVLQLLSEDTKTFASKRKVHIRPELLTAVNEINALMRKNQILSGHFLSEDGHYINYDSYRQYLGDMTAKVVGRRLTPHALRHTFVSLAAESGLSLEVIGRQVGHASEEITDIYMHVTSKMREMDNEKLDQVSIL